MRGGLGRRVVVLRPRKVLEECTFGAVFIYLFVRFKAWSLHLFRNRILRHRRGSARFQLAFCHPPLLLLTPPRKPLCPAPAPAPSQVLAAKGVPAGTRACVASCLGALCRSHGGKLGGSLAAEALAACAKQLAASLAPSYSLSVVGTRSMGGGMGGGGMGGGGMGRLAALKAHVPGVVADTVVHVGKVTT